MTERSYRQMNAVERAKFDGFYGGYSCALHAALYMDDGTSTGFLEALGCVNEREYLSYLRRNPDEPMAANIRRGFRYMRRQQENWDRNRAAREAVA